eukprot:4431315-Prorocentrum_lima.AAC.1
MPKPKSAAELCLQVFDSDGITITPSWKAYHQLLNQVQWWGRSNQCSPPITAGPYNPQTQSITVQATMLNVVHAIAQLD